MSNKVTETVLTTPTAFKSQEEIRDYNLRSFPKIEEKADAPAVKIQVEDSDHIKTARALLQKRFFAFSEVEKESSQMKVSEFRQKLKDIKENIEIEKHTRHPTGQSNSSVGTVDSLIKDIELVNSYESKLSSN